MKEINSYPSIYNLGHKALADLLKSDVIVEEKIDGSQFSFMKDEEGIIHFRSKGATIYPENPDKMFVKALTAVQEADKAIGLPVGLNFRGEYLSKPKHNVLAYERTPTQHIIIFDIDDGNQNFLSPMEKSQLAQTLGFETVPVLFEGMVTDSDQLVKLLETVSVLGGQKIEGVVLKPVNYDLYGRDAKCLMGKHVSEAFKETHGKEWKGTPGNKDIISILSAAVATEARWNKAVQHLKEAGKLQDAPQDIGPLMKEVAVDTLKECEDEIRDRLFKWAWPQLSRVVTRGLPEWYKNKLMAKQFEGEAATKRAPETDETNTEVPSPEGEGETNPAQPKGNHDASNAEAGAIAGGNSEPTEPSDNFPVPVLAEPSPEAANRKGDGEEREGNRPTTPDTSASGDSRIGENSL